ncbi:hypothetical protein BREVNS_0934 [Brevinematales bacterium NS]|nr:hypothetical protein BREVNS_0934 [Brevinematales bacterium NS]
MQGSQKNVLTVVGRKSYSRGLLYELHKLFAFESAFLAKSKEEYLSFKLFYPELVVPHMKLNTYFHISYEQGNNTKAFCYGVY